MNALAPIGQFDLTEKRFDTHVTRAFASTSQTRHMRDRLIADLHAGAFDEMLLRARTGLPALSDASERRAALNVIDYAFEPLVVPSLSVTQATAYFAAVEDSLVVSEAAGLDGPGPLWLDTVHHVCVFSVLFRMAVHLGSRRGCNRIVLLHQGQRPEPRLVLVANVLRRVHGIALVLLPLRNRWFFELVRLTTPDTVIFALADMPPEAFGRRLAAGRGGTRLELHAEPDLSLRVETISGSSVFARRLGAAQMVLDYPQADRVRIRPWDGTGTVRCPLEDWVFWPLLGGSPHAPMLPSSD